MAEPQKYDRAAAFEMLKQEHGEYASPELINKELDSFEKELGISSSKPVPADAAAPPIDVATPNTQLEVSPRDQLNTTSSAREQLNAITSSGEDRTTPVNDALSAFSKLSTKEQLLYGGGAAALTALGAKKAGEIAVQGVAKLKDRFFGTDAKPPINAGVNPAMSPATTDTGLKLSPIDQQMLDRANINTQVRQEYLNRTLGTTDPVSEAVAQTPEQIRQAKLVAASQAAQQNMAAPPPETAPKKMWEPPRAELAISQPMPVSQASVAAPVIAEPVAATPVAKATNEQVLKAINQVAPKTEPVVEAVQQPPKKAPEKTKMNLPEGWGKGMSWLATVHGVDGAQAFIDQYNKGKPFSSHKEMEEKYKEVTIRPKYSDIPKDLRRERNIPFRSDIRAVPPPSLRPSEIGQGGGSMIRSLTDPLQLKQ